MQLSLFREETSKYTNRKKFYEEINGILPINEWIELISPHYYKKEKVVGRSKKEIEILLKVYLIRQFFGLSYERCEDEIHESISARNFCGITRDKDIPDASTIFRFEALLTENKIQEQMFVNQVDTLVVEGKIIKKGTIVDSTIIDAPKSTKNIDKSRDKEAGWTKKGGNYRHGFKAHTGVDEKTGLIHSVKFTAANIHDLHAVEDCLHGEETEFYGDSGYLGVDNHSSKVKKCKKNIMKRRTSLKKLSAEEIEKEKMIQQAISSKRCKVEHNYAVIKNIFNFKYTRVRGLAKNSARFFILATLSNFYKLTRQTRDKSVLL